MRISPCCIHNKTSRVVTYGLGECLGTFFDDNVTPALGAGAGGVEWGPIFWVGARLELGDDDFGFEAWFALRGNKFNKLWRNLSFFTHLLALDGAAIDGQVSKVSKEFLGTVLALDEFEEVRCIVNELENSSDYLEINLRGEILTVVQVFPPIKTSWVKRRNKKGIFVCQSELKFHFWKLRIKLTLTPRIRNSTRARSILRRATS